MAMLACAMQCHAIPIPSLRLPEIAAESEVIIVGELNKVDVAGRDSVVVGGQAIDVTVFTGRIKVTRTLKGGSLGDVVITYREPTEGQSLGYGTLGGGTRLFFLHRSGAEIAPTTPYYPSLPASRIYGGSPDDNLMTKITSELGYVLESPSEPSASKEEILRILYAVPSSSTFTASLRRGLLSAPDPNIKYRIMTGLLRRNDVASFPQAFDLLARDDFPAPYREMFEYAIGSSITDPRAISSLEELLHSPIVSTRAAAAEAIWHIGTWSAVPAAISALKDPDAQVRYYGVRALATITGQLEWGPSIPEYQENGAKYIEHWMTWSKNFQTGVH